MYEVVSTVFVRVVFGPDTGAEGMLVAWEVAGEVHTEVMVEYVM